MVELGGDGDDTLTGGDASEDVLVDGPGDDILAGLGGDDALLHNDGADQLFGGDGNDLFLSNSICDGDLLDGGEGRDNASWAKFGEGVEAGSTRPRRAPRRRWRAGVRRRHARLAPASRGPRGHRLRRRLLRRTPEPNQLLGHAGADTYFAGGGADTILANSGDADPIDRLRRRTTTAVIDFAQYGDVVAARLRDGRRSRAEQLPQPEPSCRARRHPCRRKPTPAAVGPLDRPRPGPGSSGARPRS